MAAEVFKLNTLDVSETEVRGTRVGLKNMPSTFTFDTNATYDAHLTGANYLIQASIGANNLKGYADFIKNSKVVQNVTGINPSQVVYGDVIRNDETMDFYTVTGMEGTDILLTQSYAGATTGASCTLRKKKLGSVQFEQVKSFNDEGKFYYNKNDQVWAITGIQPEGPYTAFYTGMQTFPGDQLVFTPLPSATPSASDISSVESIYKPLVENAENSVTDLSLSPIPFPHSSLKVFIGHTGSTIKKVEGEDYVVNYGQQPEYKFPFPPFQDRKVAYLKFLDKLDKEVQVKGIDSTFTGFFNVVKRKVIPQSQDFLTPIQNIIPNSETIQVNKEDKNRNYNYTIDYPSGLCAFINHNNSEVLIDSVTYQKNIIWDGVSILKGVGEKNVQNMSKLVIPPVSGLEGITGLMYFEDTDDNALTRGSDYILEYSSGAISIETEMKENEAVLVSYFVEGLDEESEDLPIVDIKTKKFPVMPNTITLTKRWRNAITGEAGSTVMTEGTDYEVFYLTGKISILTFVPNEEILTLSITYTPLSQINCILQPIPGSNTSYKMTLIDDSMKTMDALNMVYQIQNPMISVPVVDPFKASDDPTRTTYQSDPETFLSVKILGQPGFGFKNYTDEQLYALGIDNLIALGLSEAIGISEDQVRSLGITGVVNLGFDNSTVGLDITKYKYDSKTKLLTIKPEYNINSVPDANDTIVSSYSFEGDSLPYAPVEYSFPVFSAGTNYFVIEGFDRTDVLYPEMVVRIDNFDPENTYFFKIKSVSFDGDNTHIELYADFPDDIRNPSFSLFDDFMNWEDMPEGTTIDKTTMPKSSSIRLKGNTLALLTSLRPDSLLLLDNKYVYTVLSASANEVDKTVAVNIFPALQTTPHGVVQISRTPVYEESEVNIVSKFPILTDPAEPAFQISYAAPMNHEGTGSIIIDKQSIIITENVDGKLNPNAYVYKFSDYTTIKDIITAIRSTDSTFHTLDSTIPTYRPFTISSALNTEDYYLSLGDYSADLIIPFDEGIIVDLPYTVTIIPELYKWSLLEVFKNSPSFTIKATDKTSMFTNGNLMAFQNRVSGTTSYYEVSGSTGISGTTATDTQVTLKDTIRENIVNPNAYKFDNAVWVTAPVAISLINYDTSEITFVGDVVKYFRPGTMVKFDSRYIYAVVSVEFNINTTVVLEATLNKNVKIQNSSNYVQVTAYNILLGQKPTEPFFSITYTAPPGRTGEGHIKIDEDKVTLIEILDGGTRKEVEFKFSDFTDIYDLTLNMDTYEDFNVSGFTPFTADASAYQEELEQGKFVKYALPKTGGEVTIPYTILVAEKTFDIGYTRPVGHNSSASIKFFSDRLEITETDPTPIPAVKTTTINYVNKSVYDITDEIENIDSVVTGNKPFAVVLGTTGEQLGLGLFGYFAIAGNVDGPIGDFYSVKTTGAIIGWNLLGPLNIRRLVPEIDYIIEGGSITLTDSVLRGDRLKLSYMGLDALPDVAGKDVTCSCRFISSLPKGYSVFVYMDYINQDQFYLQTLTQRDFLEIVTVPQVQQIMGNKATGGGQGSDTAGDDNVRVYEGGTINLKYLLRDEEIKKDLYIKLWDWYKHRLRNFTSEEQVILGFKFGHSTAVGKSGSTFSLTDDSVEKLTVAPDVVVDNPDYTLTRLEDFNQIKRQFSKYFPMDYDDSAPLFYDRFGTEYQSYNECYIYNIKYTFEDGRPAIIEGRVKSVNPYWTKGLDYTILSQESETPVSGYTKAISSDDKVFKPSGLYDFLKRIDVGDQVKPDESEDYYDIGRILTGTDTSTTEGGTYEVLVLKDGQYFKEEGIKTVTMKVLSGGDYKNPADVKWEKKIKRLSADKTQTKTFTEYEAALSGEGYNINVNRKTVPFFPCYDDNFSLGAKIVGGKITGQRTDTDRIKKFSLYDLLKILFLPYPVPTPAENIRMTYGTYNEDTLKYDPIETIPINIADLSFFDQRKVSSIRDGIYNNTDDARKDTDEIVGLKKYFYISFEKIYTPNTKKGYIEGFVLRAKDRNLWFQFSVDDGEDVAEDYGFTGTPIFQNFYMPDNMYRYLLREKQGWEIEEDIIRDEFDIQDKIARAYQDGILNGPYSTFKEKSSGANDGFLPSVSNLLSGRIPTYAPHLDFLISDEGPLAKTISEGPNASEAIGKSYYEAVTAKSKYTNFRNEQDLAITTNANNLSTWTNDYVRWVLSLKEGTQFQKDARDSIRENSGVLTIGFKELPGISLKFNSNHPTYTVTNPLYGVYFVAAVSDHALVINAIFKSKANPNVNSPKSGTKVFKLSEYTTLQTLSDAVNQFYLDDGQDLISCTTVFEFHPYGSYPTVIFSDKESKIVIGKRLLDTAGPVNDVPTVAIPDTGATLLVCNVDDHRGVDPRVLFLDKKVDDYLRLDVTGGINVKVFPRYVSNNNENKKILDELELPVSGHWAVSPTDFPSNYFQVLTVGPAKATWSMSYKFVDTDVNGQVRDYSTPQSEIDLYRSTPMSQEKYNEMINRGLDSPKVFILKELVLTKIGSTTISFHYNLRQYDTIYSLATAIDSTRQITEEFNIRDSSTYTIKTKNENISKSYGTEIQVVAKVTNISKEQDYDISTYTISADGKEIMLDATNSTNSSIGMSDSDIIKVQYAYLSLSRSAGGDKIFKVTNPDLSSSITDQGQMKSYEIKSEYKAQALPYEAEILVPTYDPITGLQDGTTTEYKGNITIGWTLQSEDLKPGQSATFEMAEKRYSELTTYRFIPNSPADSRADLLSNRRVDTLAFDLYSWDNNAYYQVVYRVREGKIVENNIILTSDYVNCTIPLIEGELLYDTSGRGNGLINRINSNPACNKYFFAHLKFNRSNDGLFEYTYLPETAITRVVKANLDTLYLGIDDVITIDSLGKNFTYQVVPIATPPLDTSIVNEASTLLLDADVKTLRLGVSSSYNSVTSETYNLDSTGSLLTLSANYSYNYNFTQTFVLSSYTLDTLTSTLNALDIPHYLGNPVFSAVKNPAVSGALSAAVLNSAVGNILRREAFPNDCISITPGPSGTGFFISNGSYSIQGGVLTVQITITYTGTYTPPSFDLTDSLYDTVQELSDAIVLLKPFVDFPALFISQVLNSGSTASAELLDSEGTQSIGTDSNLYTHKTISYGLNGSFSNLMTNINSDTDTTGFSATAVEGYKRYPCKYLVPGEAIIVPGQTIMLQGDFRVYPAIYLLNMDTPGTISISGSGLPKVITATKLNKTYTDSLSTRNLVDLVATIKGDINTHLLGVTVLPIGVEGTTYGLLNNIAINMSLNSPESTVSTTNRSGAHIYFGFLGDIRFYQISDYNLNSQLQYIKRRLAKPWTDENGVVIPDFYNRDDFSEFEFGISTDQFLNYLKIGRFQQIGNSIQNEAIINNKYLWIFLKFHKEFGCDQLVEVYQKQIKSNSRDANLLGAVG